MTRPTFKELLKQLRADLRNERRRLQRLNKYAPQLRTTGCIRGIERAIRLVKRMQEQKIAYQEGVRA